MLYQLYIIDSGLCIFSYNFRREKSGIDEQLLSGFLSAIGSFAEETFSTGLQSIQIRSGEKLSFYIEEKFNLVFCAICDEKDNNKLLEELLKEISERFCTEMQNVLNSRKRSMVTQYDPFVKTLKNIVKGKDKKRNAATNLQGLIMGLLTAFAGILIYSVFLIKYESFVLMVYLPIMLLISAFVSGFYAGTTRSGLINGLFFFVACIWFLNINVPGSIKVLAPVLPYIAIVCAAGGFYGGLKCDEKKLYPLPDDTLIQSLKDKIEEKKETQQDYSEISDDEMDEDSLYYEPKE